ncbi:MAG: acyl-CoA dehydrogenase family protein [Burkholderiaceae bacterium]|nr:acyl-CoA dehydrogenase family protein [Burkholderiaceae bacterium]
MDLNDIAQAMTATTPVPDNFGINRYRDDPDLAALLSLYLSAPLRAHLAPHLDTLGGLAGGRLDALAGTADRNPPTIEHRSRNGLDRQRVIKHPDYVELERTAYSTFGLAALSHRGGVLGWHAPMPATAKYALTFLFVQAEFGLCCPVSMTDSLTRTLRKFGAPELVARYLPALTSLDFDELAQGAMFMTEQGAGSDVGATETRAWQDDSGNWRLTGDKWFCSNPDASLAMVLARPDGGQPGTRGLTLFLLPRDLPDGSHNQFRILRLKDKLGTRSMASGEIRLEGAIAYPVGDLGRGFVQMTDMINNSRLSNGVRAAGLMRRAVSDAMFVAREREAFGRHLVDLPLMRRQLAKMTMRAEQARTMMFLTAAALERADAGDESSRRLARIMTPLIKFRACRDARVVTGDAMEVRGGCGYIEEWADPRILRDAHLGSIWEGTSNIVALDVIRSMRREQSLEAYEALLDTLLADAAPDAALSDEFARARTAVLSLARTAAEKGRDAIARQAASGLYHLVTAAGMAREANRCALPHRQALAGLVLRHRLLPRDPLAIVDDDAAIDAVIDGKR